MENVSYIINLEPEKATVSRFRDPPAHFLTIADPNPVIFWPQLFLKTPETNFFMVFLLRAFGGADQDQQNLPVWIGSSGFFTVWFLVSRLLATTTRAQGREEEGVSCEGQIVVMV